MCAPAIHAAPTTSGDMALHAYLMTFQAHISVRRVARTRYPCSTDNVQRHSRPTISVRWHAPAIHAAPTMFNDIPGPQYPCAEWHTPAIHAAPTMFNDIPGPQYPCAEWHAPAIHAAPTMCQLTTFVLCCGAHTHLLSHSIRRHISTPQHPCAAVVQYP